MMKAHGFQEKKGQHLKHTLRFVGPSKSTIFHATLQGSVDLPRVSPAGDNDSLSF